MSYFEHEGIRFCYEVLDEGMPFVFSHGLGSDLQQPMDLCGTLDGYQRIVWDCRGHGQTEPVGPNNKFNFTTFAEDLNALLHHLNINQVIMGGISMGAAVSARFAVLYPNKIKALVLMRPAWIDQPMPESLSLIPYIADTMEAYGSEEGLKRFRLSPELEEIQRQSADNAESLCQQFQSSKAYERRARLREIPNDAPIADWKEVEQLDIPALVVGNEPDPTHPLEFAKAWAGHLPQCRLIQIPSKIESIENHTLSFQKHLTDFLKSIS